MLKFLLRHSAARRDGALADASQTAQTITLSSYEKSSCACSTTVTRRRPRPCYIQLLDDATKVMHICSYGHLRRVHVTVALEVAISDAIGSIITVGDSGPVQSQRGPAQSSVATRRSKPTSAGRHQTARRSPNPIYRRVATQEKPHCTWLTAVAL